MKSIRQLLGYDDKFFDLLEASANEASASVRLLVTMMKAPDANASMDDFVQARRKDKNITEQLTEELCRTFVTPLEREDIEKLATTLYKIPKTVEKFTERFLISRGSLKFHDFSGQLGILEQATATVVIMVGLLRRHPQLGTMKDHNDKLHHLEGEADKLMLKVVSDLYAGKHEPLQVIMTLDLCDMLEKIIDRCRDAGNVIFQVVLKYS